MLASALAMLTFQPLILTAGVCAAFPARPQQAVLWAASLAVHRRPRLPYAAQVQELACRPIQ